MKYAPTKGKKKMTRETLEVTLRQKEKRRRKKRRKGRKRRKRRKRRKIMENHGTSWNIIDHHRIQN